METRTDKGTVKLIQLVEIAHSGTDPAQNMSRSQVKYKKIRVAAQRRGEIFVLLGGAGGMLPRKF